MTHFCLQKHVTDVAYMDKKYAAKIEIKKIDFTVLILWMTDNVLPSLGFGYAFGN